MAVYAIGDIHGCFTALKTIFDSLKIKEDDKVIFLGDYVDRGPQCRQLLEWLVEKSENKNFIFLRGNHEQMMMDARTDSAWLSCWLMNGGAKVLDSYDIGDDAEWFNKIPYWHWEFLKSTKKYFEFEKFIFVHAALDAGVSLQKQNENTLYWKHIEVPEMYDENKIVVCGHTSRKNGVIANFGHSICIDTWACGGQWLTCLDVTTGNFWQANQRGELQRGKIEVG